MREQQSERFALKGGALLVGRIAEKAAQFFVLVLVARLAPVEMYGNYSLAVYFTAMCTILLDWGIQPYSIREVARDFSLAPRFFRHGIFLKSIYALIGIGLLSGILLAIRYPRPVWKAIVILFLGRVLLSFAQFNGALFRAHGRMHYETAMAVAGSITLLAGTWLCLHLNFGLLGLVMVWLFYGATELAVSLVFLLKWLVAFRSLALPVQPRVLSEMNRQSLVFGLCSACTLIYFYLDTVILSKTEPMDVVSRYTAAYNVVFALILLPQVLVDTVFPFLSRRYLGEGLPIENVVSTISRYFLLLVIPLGLGVSLLAGPIIRFIYGERYVDGNLGADRALSILIWDACLIFFTYLYGQVLAIFGKQARVTLVAGIGAVINIVLNLVLIPRFSLIGAAVATVTTEFINLVLLAFFLCQALPSVNSGLPVKQAALGTLSMGIFLWQFGTQLPLAANILWASATYSLVLFLTGTFRRADLLMVRRCFF
jgi:O-antigen/teichoic acid export membrane protein